MSGGGSAGRGANAPPVSGLFIGRGAVATDVHVGYFAGRYRSGVWSDQWTDVSRCAERTFHRLRPGLRLRLARPRPRCHP